VIKCLVDHRALALAAGATATAAGTRLQPPCTVPTVTTLAAPPSGSLRSLRSLAHRGHPGVDDAPAGRFRRVLAAIVRGHVAVAVSLPAAIRATFAPVRSTFATRRRECDLAGELEIGLPPGAAGFAAREGASESRSFAKIFFNMTMEARKASANRGALQLPYASHHSQRPAAPEDDNGST